jgi:hypothetical protein
VVRLDVSLGTCNAAPEALIHTVPEVRKKTPVEFDGSGSVDRNLDPLSFHWTLATKPPQSKSELQDASASKAHLTPDSGGVYKIDLVVSDGELESPVEEATLIVDNKIPKANAGPDFVWPLNMQAALDGSASSDEDGDALTYTWAIEQAPSGSLAVLDDPHSVRPHFTPDIKGVYAVSLKVNDGDADSIKDFVRVGGGITGVPPIADAGPNVNAILGVRVRLDGSGSFDPDGSMITYSWRVKTQPPRSLAQGTFDDPTAVMPQFQPQKEGVYTLELRVDDEFYESPPATTQVSVVPGTGAIGDYCEPNGCASLSICGNDGTCIPRGGCGTKTQAGSDMPETHDFDLGQTSGTFKFSYDTFTIEDQIDVIYENKNIFSTGCVGHSDTVTLMYSGGSSIITVQVTPNCAGGSGTAWNFEVDCPM